MKNPKFLPGDLVKFISHLNEPVICRILYCKLPHFSTNWVYALEGWSNNFKENDLEYFNPSSQ